MNVLEDYLDTFKGIVITVSHDRYFLDRIVDGLFVFKDQEIHYVNGGYSASIDITNTRKKQNLRKKIIVNKLKKIEKED